MRIFIANLIIIRFHLRVFIAEAIHFRRKLRIGSVRSKILAAVPERSHMILLAIDGKQRSSEDFSAHLDDLALRGMSDLTFVIGGSDGVSDEVRARADETFSFGPITLPHNLARVVLLEQLYRACKISRGEPYHK